jgi:hypothetical protein
MLNQINLSRLKISSFYDRITRLIINLYLILIKKIKLKIFIGFLQFYDKYSSLALNYKLWNQCNSLKYLKFSKNESIFALIIVIFNHILLGEITKF